MPTYARKHDFGAILDPRGSQEWTLWAPFSVRKAPKRLRPRITGAVPEPTWSRLGAENGPRTYFHRSRVDF